MRFESYQCYLCGSREYTVRPGRVRDDEGLRPLECVSCGLVSLSSFSHIDADFYKHSKMRRAVPCDPAIMNKVAMEDDVRRFHDFYPLLSGKRLLDFGCGAGGFLALARNKAEKILGLELDQGWTEIHKTQALPIVSSLSEITGRQFDVITMFHVLEHLPDPIRTLREIKNILKPGGRLVVEVPNADDALLTHYHSRAFSEFTYWSCHLFLFNQFTLTTLIGRAGFAELELRQFQRYPLANHLHWLAQGKPGGQETWPELVDPGLDAAYSRVLAAQGKCDTLIGVFVPEGQ